MRKRILAFFLAGIVTFSMVPTEAFAASAITGTADGEGTLAVTEETADQEEAALSTDNDGTEEGGTPAQDNGTEEDGTPVQDGGTKDSGTPAQDGGTKDESTSAQDGISMPKGQEEADTGLVDESQESGLKHSEDSELAGSESSEAAEALSAVEGSPQQQSVEEWTPPMGGLERPKMIEIPDETAESLGIMDVEEAAGGELSSHSAIRGSRKYDSSWDVYSTNYIYNRLPQNEKNFWDMLDELAREYLNGTQNAVRAKVLNTQGKAEYYYATEKGISYTYFGLSDIRVEDLFTMFSYSNPQYYFLGNGFLRGNGAVFLIIYDGFADGTTRAAETAKVKAQIDAMVSQVAAGKTDVEKAKIAHDLICQKVWYDDDYLTSPHTLYHQSAYSVFCENYTVCAGYTKAFTILMNGVGVDTMSVTSNNHAWNMISLNDSWYNIDCTWDDTDGRMAGYGEIVYQFFNRSTPMITGKLDERSSHQMESCYQGVTPAATQDSNATLTSIGTIGTPSATTASPKISKKDTSGGCLVTLSTSTPGADIYYTVDGTEPSSAFSRSHLYTDSFEVEHNTTVKAIAVRDTMWDSQAASLTVKKTTYTVKFDTRGYGSISSKNVISGEKVKKPASPKRSNYTFEGWYTSTSYKKEWNFNNQVTKNMTLYAKWKKVSVGKASINKLTNVSGKKMKVTVKKVSGAKGYQIRYATNSKMKSAKSTTSTKTSKTIGSLKKGKKYYVRVRAYKTDSKGKKIYGAWSKAKTVKIQK